jgi:hypothetical protein
MKNYNRLNLNEVANTYTKMILNEAEEWWQIKDNRRAWRYDPRNPYTQGTGRLQPPPGTGWVRKPYPSAPSGFPKDRNFINPKNPKGYWRWDQTQTTRPAAKPIRGGLRPAAGAAGGALLALSLYNIYQQLFGDDGIEADVIPDDGQEIKPVNVDQPGLDLQPLYVPPHQIDPNNYPGQHPVRPPKAPAGGSQGSGGGIGGGGGMGM